MAAHRARIWFHWITLVLVASAYVIALARTGIDDPDQRLFWLDCHRAIGLALFALTALRLLARVVLPFERVHEPSRVLRLLARGTHAALYAGLVAMPLLGWAQSSAKAHKFKLFDHEFPRLLAHNSDLADRLGTWHENLAWLILALIAAHSLAALYHHFIKRDSVLIDMLRTRRAGTAR